MKTALKIIILFAVLATAVSTAIAFIRKKEFRRKHGIKTEGYYDTDCNRFGI